MQLNSEDPVEPLHFAMHDLRFAGGEICLSCL